MIKCCNKHLTLNVGLNKIKIKYSNLTNHNELIQINLFKMMKSFFYNCLNGVSATNFFGQRKKILMVKGLVQPPYHLKKCPKRPNNTFNDNSCHNM